MTEMSPPLLVYRARLAEREAEARAGKRLELFLSNARLGVTAAGLILAWAAAGPGWIPSSSVLLPVAAFVILLFVHDRAIRDRKSRDRAVDFYRRGCDRLEHQWAGKGEAGLRFMSEKHVYSRDLDLFGKGSLFELLCTVRTRAGEESLASWLLSPAPIDEIRSRQEAVAELQPRLDLREAFALIGREGAIGASGELLSQWAMAPRLRGGMGGARILAPVLALATVAAAGLFAAGSVGTLPLYVMLFLETGLALALRPFVIQTLRAVEEPARHLALLSHGLRLFEENRFAAARLVELQRSLETGGVSPSSRIARLRRLTELLDNRRNPLFAPVAALLLWGTQFALAIEGWRAESGCLVPRWIAALGEFEALLALSGYAHENPDVRFPELTEGGPCFEGLGLGHPLIPGDRLVKNDVRLDLEAQLLVVSGSNMSGKSTLLRTVGVNTVLALAGAPVRAEQLRLSPLAVGASIRIEDSLQDGVSRFFAEITRLRQIVTLLDGPLPALFLLDEILQGTNSHDRRIGAEAVVRRLVEGGAIGLITTHDLALARIADALAPRAANIHFEDHVEDGGIRFDYRIRPGVVQKSNALALMRAVGLVL
jgi:hypothetical protein